MLFKELQEQISATNFDHLIVLGDFNGMVNNEVDRSTTHKNKKLSKGKLPDSFFRLVKNEGLIGFWRKKNLDSRDYTFYSSRHKVWSRIDMVWISKELELLTSKIDILPRSVSDHNPIIWKAKKVTEINKIWRINRPIR